MSVGVVELLKIVDVHEKHGAGLAAGQMLFNMGNSALTVQDAGKRVLHDFSLETFLQLYAIINVQHNADHCAPAVLCDNLMALIIHPEPCAVFADDPVLNVIAAGFPETVIDGFFYSVPIFGSDDFLHFFIGFFYQFIIRIAQVIQHGIIDNIERKSFLQITAHNSARQHGKHDIYQLPAGGGIQLPNGLPAVLNWKIFFAFLLV